MVTRTTDIDTDFNCCMTTDPDMGSAAAHSRHHHDPGASVHADEYGPSAAWFLDTNMVSAGCLDPRHSHGPC